MNTIHQRPSSQERIAHFEQNYVNLYPRILHFISRFVHQREAAEDLTQDAFTKAYTKLETWKPDLTMTKWIYQIAHNCMIDYLRREKCHPQESLPYEVASRERFEEYVTTCDALSSVHQPRTAIFVELCLYGATYDEMAARFAIKRSTVKHVVYHARKDIMQALEVAS